MNRRAFLSRVTRAAVLVCGGSAFFAGCGSGSDSTGEAGSSGGGATDGTCTTGAGVAYTNLSHVHDVVTLSQAEVADTTPRALMLLTGDHDHVYDFTMQDFTDLQNGQVVTKTEFDLASGQSHDHILQITC